MKEVAFMTATVCAIGAMTHSVGFDPWFFSGLLNAIVAGIGLKEIIKK